MSVTFRAGNTATTSSGTTVTITKPTGTISGDVLVAVVSADGHGAGGWSGPSGWTLVNSQVTAFLVSNGIVTDYDPTSVFVKTAGGSEPANYAFTNGYSANLVGGIVGYFGSLGFDAASGGSAPAGAGVGATPTVSLTTTQPNELIIAACVAVDYSSAITASTGATSRETVTGSASANSLLIEDLTGPASPALSTMSSTNGPSWSTSNNGQIIILVSLLGGATPLAPTLTAPAYNAYTDLAVNGGPFVWTYNTGGSSGGQTGYDFRQRTTGATGYSYWNATSGLFQSTDTTNTATAQTLTFSAAVLTDNFTYAWSVATLDAGGLGPYATDSIVTGQIAPTLTVGAPTGTVTTTQYPTVTWTPTFAASSFQGSYRVVTYNSTQYGAGGFTPGSGPNVDDSGVVSSTATTYTTANFLPSGVSYRSYVQVVQSPGLQASSWQYTSYTVTTDAPQTPMISAAYSTDGVTGCPRITLTVDAFDNILSASDSSFESSLGTTVAISNCSVSRSTTQAEDGTHSLAMNASASGAMSAGTATGLSGYAVLPNTSYTFRSDYRSGSTSHAGRTVRTDVIWYTSAGSVISTSTGNTATDTASGWVTSSTSATSPGTAAFAALTYNVLGTTGGTSGEVHYVDEAGIFPGTPSQWSIGGFVGTSSIEILRSDGLYVRQASPANPFPVPTPSQIATIYDYEANPGTSYTYKAWIVSGNFASQASAGSSPVSVPTGLGFWELDPTNYPSATNAQPTQWNVQNFEQSASHQVLQQTTVNIVASAMQIADMTATFSIFTSAIYTAFTSLLLSQVTVFVSDPYGSSYYFRLAPAPGGLSAGTGNKAKDSQLQGSSAGNPYRIIAVTGVGQPRPQV